MLFQKIFVEYQVAEYPQTLKILAKLPNTPVHFIGKIEDIFERAKKPYLQKRTSLNLFIGRKEGQLVKLAPDAYGVEGDPHYYFIHAYNCIYECEYCYLQGYFHSPDIVFFVNHEEIAAEIKNRVSGHPTAQTVWFHAGEFSDSLALCHISGELEFYWKLFRELPAAKLELRTKSVNIKPVLELEPLDNIIISFSLSPKEAVVAFDRKTPSLNARLKALKKLAAAGFQLGLHFDPIIYSDNFEYDYNLLINSVLQAVPERQINYISLGVVRFSRKSFAEFAKNYPHSQLLAAEFIKSFDDKIRYNRPQRLFILKTVRAICRSAGISEEKIYLCMENESLKESI